jgi:hypothetical protein
MTRMAGSKNVTDFLGIKPEYGAIGSQDIADTAREFAAVTAGNALTANAGLKAQADIAAAQHYKDVSARATNASTEAMVGKIAGDLIGFAGGIGKLGGGGSSFGSIGRSMGGTPLTGAFTPGGSLGSFP